MLQTALNFLKSNPAVIFTAISALCAILAYRFSKQSFGRTRAATLYSDIDARYMELLKLGIANPKFVNPDLTRDYTEHFKGNDLLAYQQYAFAAWNIVETIIDRREIENLGGTWDPVIKEENRLHRVWLNAPNNQHKFKKDFWQFLIKNSKDFPCPDCDGGSICARCTKLLEMVNSKEAIPILPLIDEAERKQIGPIGVLRVYRT